MIKKRTKQLFEKKKICTVGNDNKDLVLSKGWGQIVIPLSVQTAGGKQKMNCAPKQDFLTILHLAERYQDQYRERNLCLSPEQNDAFFRDFVEQYYSAIYWGKEPSPVINTEIPLF